MAFRVNRLRVVAADDAGFSDLVSALLDVPRPASIAVVARAIRSRWSWPPTRATTTRSHFSPSSARSARPYIRLISCSSIGPRGWPSTGVPATKCNGRTLSASTCGMPMMIRLRSTSQAVFAVCRAPSCGP